MLVVETMVETSPRGLAKARSTPEWAGFFLKETEIMLKWSSDSV
jgi:hypothetical protein